MEEADLVEGEVEVIVMEVAVVIDVFVLQVAVVVVIAEVDVWVEVVMEIWLIDDPVRFSTYHRLHSDH